MHVAGHVHSPRAGNPHRRTAPAPSAPRYVSFASQYGTELPPKTAALPPQTGANLRCLDGLAAQFVDRERVYAGIRAVWRRRLAVGRRLGRWASGHARDHQCDLQCARALVAAYAPSVPDTAYHARRRVA
eukprot:3477873-Rhodomonas_salina.4